MTEVEVVGIVRVEVDRVVAPMLESLSGIGTKLDGIQSSFQTEALTRVAMVGRIDRIDERSTANRDALIHAQQQLATTREEQSGITAWKAVVGALILSASAALIGVAITAAL